MRIYDDKFEFDLKPPLGIEMLEAYEGVTDISVFFDEISSVKLTRVMLLYYFVDIRLKSNNFIRIYPLIPGDAKTVIRAIQQGVDH